MFKVTTFRGWATDDQGDRIGANTSLGLVSATNLFTSVLEGDRVAVQQGAGRSWGKSNWVMVGHVEGEGEAQTLAASLLNSPYCGDAIAAARKYDFGALVFIMNAHEGETKARLLGLVSDVAALLRRDSQWVL
jgi:hypothetical protein